MTDTHTQPTILSLDDHIDVAMSKHIDIERNEIFVIGFEKIVIANLLGKIITIHTLNEDEEVVGMQRMHNGWQYLSLEGKCLKNHNLISGDVIELENTCEELKTASWSPCGRFVAAGSKGSTFFVWDVETGKQCMKKTIQWDDNVDFINPPTLTIKGWSNTGENIITNAEVVMSNNIMTWNFKTQKLVSIVEC